MARKKGRVREWDNVRYTVWPGCGASEKCGRPTFTSSRVGEGCALKPSPVSIYLPSQRSG